MISFPSQTVPFISSTISIYTNKYSRITIPVCSYSPPSGNPSSNRTITTCTPTIIQLSTTGRLSTCFPRQKQICSLSTANPTPSTCMLGITTRSACSSRLRMSPTTPTPAKNYSVLKRGWTEQSKQHNTCWTKESTSITETSQEEPLSILQFIGKTNH